LQSINTTNNPHSIRDTFTLDSRGNTVEHKTRTYKTLTGLGDDYNITTSTYDNNKSPFSSVNGARFISLGGKNNVLRINEKHYVIGTSNPPDIFDTDFTGGYIFNANGYPVISTFVDVPATSSIQYKSTCVYTTL
jgi:hypothetical protein